MCCKAISSCQKHTRNIAPPSASSACGLSEQSSRRNETTPGVGASGSAAAMYSIDFFSKIFCDKSRNCKTLAYRASGRMYDETGWDAPLRHRLR